MSNQAFVLVVALGAAAIALWIDVRLKSRTPRRPKWTIVHLGASFVVLQVMPALVALMVAGADEPGRKMAAIFLLVLPALTYTWLSAIWLLKLLQRVALLRM